MIKKTYWIKDDMYLTKASYMAYAKQASRRKIPVTTYLIALGFQSEFTSKCITGRPKDIDRKKDGDNSMVVREGGVKIQVIRPLANVFIPELAIIDEVRKAALIA